LYEENTVITVSSSDAALIIENLKRNDQFIYESNRFEKFIVGKILTICSISQGSGDIRIKYMLW